MKSIKEIGKIEEIQGISFKQKLIVMTEQERRELVRAALETFCQEWIYPEDTWEEIKGAATKQIEGFIKENGL